VRLGFAGLVPDFSGDLGHGFCVALLPKSCAMLRHIKSGPCVSHIVRHSGPEFVARSFLQLAAF